MTARPAQAFAILLLLCAANPIWAANCAKPSPTVLRGGELRDPVVPVELAPAQLNSLRTLFAFADRRWGGRAKSLLCVGTESNPRPKVTDFKLRVDGEGDRAGMILEIEMSHDDGVRREILGLQVEDGMLKLREGGRNHVDIISLRANEVAVRVPYTRRNRNGGVVHIEGFWSFARQGNDLVIHSETYSAGGLAGEAHWRLKPR